MIDLHTHTNYSDGTWNLRKLLEEAEKTNIEVLSITDTIRELITRGASSIEIRKAALEEGYRPLIIDGIGKVISGITTLDELNNKLVIY